MAGREHSFPRMIESSLHNSVHCKVIRDFLILPLCTSAPRVCGQYQSLIYSQWANTQWSAARSFYIKVRQYHMNVLLQEKRRNPLNMESVQKQENLQKSYGHFPYSREFCHFFLFLLPRHFPYSRDFVIFPDSRHFLHSRREYGGKWYFQAILSCFSCFQTLSVFEGFCLFCCL